MPVETILDAGVVASLLTILTYAAGGYVYSLTGLGKNKITYRDTDHEVTYDTSQGKWPVLIFGGAGALVVAFGAEFTPGTIEAFAVFVAFILDQLRQMYFAATSAYAAERKEGATQTDALLVGFREAVEAGDPEAVATYFQRLTGEYGQPSAQNVADRSEQVRESYREGGGQGVYDDHLDGAYHPVDEEEDRPPEPPEGPPEDVPEPDGDETVDTDRRSAISSPLRAYNGDADPDEGKTPDRDEDHYVGDGDGDGDDNDGRESVITDRP